jgi:23S rRNA (uracil1939-C5)-methyltransferase
VSQKKKILPPLEQIAITGIAAEGKAIARTEGLVIFVPYVVPGDVVDLQIVRKKNRYAEGKVIRFHRLSDCRETPFCEHFGVCGGCKWQHLPYSEQLRYKQQQVIDTLERIGQIELPPVSQILGSAKTCFYRNKLEFTFSDKRWLTETEVQSQELFHNMEALGFHIPGMFDKVLDINKCWLQDDVSNQIRLEIKAFCLTHNYSFFNLRNQCGLMRNIIIRTSTTGEVMLVVVFFEHDAEKIQILLQHIADTFPQLSSLLYIVNTKANDTITDREVFVFKGNDCIYEQMEGLRFKIGAKTFYQTNSDQASRLYGIVRDFAALSGNELIYDLYTGAGTIACFLARMARQVIGIEYVPEAVEDARQNSAINQITNTAFYAGDMKDLLNSEFISQHGHPDVIIADPPRAGMHADVIQAILFAAPHRIVYVSCNPATQARDLNLLSKTYCVTKIQPVDMFPHTHHVENVVLLEKK